VPESGRINFLEVRLDLCELASETQCAMKARMSALKLAATSLQLPCDCNGRRENAPNLTYWSLCGKLVAGGRK